MGGAEDRLDETMKKLLSGPPSPWTATFRKDVADFGGRVFALLGLPIEGEPPEVVDSVGAVLQILIRQLGSSVGTAAVSVDPEPAAAPPQSSPVVELRALAESLTVDGRLGDAAPPDTPEQLWEWVHLRALCLPEDQADRARKSAAAIGHKSAAAIGHEVDDGFPVPACPTFGYRGWDDSAVRDEVQVVLGDDDALAAHVRILATVLGILDRFRPIQTAHARYTPDPPDTIQTSVEAEEYRKLVLALIAVQPVSSLERALSCDEAIRSAYPWPLPASNSWWVARLRESERCVQDLAKTAVLTVVDPVRGDRDLRLVNAEDRVVVRGTGDQPNTVLWPLRIGCRPEPRVTARALVVEPG